MKNTLNLMKALSDEIRLRIINILFYTDLYVCEIVDILRLPQSTVSRHLTILKNAEIIEDTREGLWIKYKLIESEKYNNVIKNIVVKELIKDKQCCRDLGNMKKRINSGRGCKNKCQEVKE